MNNVSEKSNLIKGLDAKYFNDRQIFNQIKAEVFEKNWLIACHVSQVANAGDYYSFSVLDQDIVIIRDEALQLRALYNVCQHRGHKLLQDSGNKRNIVCPYHAWTYDLTGQLKRARNAENVAGFDFSQICIPSLKLEVFLGFIFVNMDNNAKSMDELYPGVKDAALSLCPDIEDRKFAYKHDIEEGCNWLIAVENYNECYHCKFVHPQFAKGVIDPNSYTIKPFNSGKVLHHSSLASSSDKAWYDVSGSDYGSFFLWPCFSLQIYPGGVINTYHWRPLEVNNTRVIRGWYSKDGEVDETLKTIIELDRTTTFSEDLSLVKNVQRGIKSKGYKPGPLIINEEGGINNELSISALHNWLRTSLDK